MFLLLVLAFGSPSQEIGVTYSYPHALWLYDGDETKAKAVLEQAAQAGIKDLRLIIHWNWCQPDSSGQFDFSSLEWQLEIMEKYGAETVILCLGRKVPRWPEYHIPEWAKQLPEEEFRQKLIRYIEGVISHYSDDHRITHFQVENEPLSSFGEGKEFWQKRFDDQQNFLAAEISIVEKYDHLCRPIIVTDPGDFGNYNDAAENADILGVSYYGVVYNSWLGYFPNRWLYKKFFRFFIGNFLCGPWFQAETISQFIGGKSVWMVEGQGEPWGPKDNRSLSPEESAKSMNPEKLRQNLEAVRQAGFKGPIFLWGIEWMAWMRDKGHREMWETVEGLVRK
ncbi:hypothetical protein GYA54_02885 [Candidatus Kuenenbacteria bacterium]|nr:hypothetical protein [Candidatus Kuenenbacteria bacterium]